MNLKVNHITITKKLDRSKTLNGPNVPHEQ